LEKKLDCLVSLLATSNRVALDGEPALASPTSQLAELESPSRANSHIGVDEILNNHGSAYIEAPRNIPSGFQSSPAVLQSAYTFDTLDQEAEVLLAKFRHKMAFQMPFVIIPPQWGSDELQRQRPFLWRAVMTAASYQNNARQEELGWSLMQDFTTRLLFKSETSLDLLQGLIVHVSWYVTPLPFLSLV
jgi:hypothetical protein